MADSGNIIKKIARTMSYRDNSQDDPEYAPLQDEKSIFEQRGEHANARKKRNVLRTISYGLVLVSLVISVTLNAMAWRKLVELKRTSLSDGNGHEHQHTTYDSPIDRDIGLQYNTTPINGSVHKPTIYRQRPSKEVDDAWLALGTNYGSVVIPVDEAANFGIQQGQVQRVAEQGGGYMADVFVFHDLHCLNLIRQTSHFNWDYYRAKAYTDEAPGTAFEEYKDEDDLYEHFTHCLDMLRQFIMCNANTALYSQWYVEGLGENGKPGPDKDFNFNGQCKNFDAILGWYEKNHIDMDTTLVRYRPGDVILEEAT